MYSWSHEDPDNHVYYTVNNMLLFLKVYPTEIYYMNHKLEDKIDINKEIKSLKRY